MLLVFHLDVIKVYLDVAYMQVFQVFLYVCCKCFIWMCWICLQWLHVFSSFCVSDVRCKFFSCFECMLRVFHLDVTKVKRVLHMLNGTNLPQSLATAIGASLWVTVRAPEAGGRIPGAVAWGPRGGAHKNRQSGLALRGHGLRHKGLTTSDILERLHTSGR
jgi:hypothetical protein